MCVCKYTGDLECSICQDLMASTHSLRCGHTFCGLCILQWLKQGKGTCPECRATIPPHEKPNRVLTCDKIIEGLRPTLTPDQIQNLDERIAEFKKLQGRQAAAAQSIAGGRRSGRGRGAGGRGEARGAANAFFRTPQEVSSRLPTANPKAVPVRGGMTAMN